MVNEKFVTAHYENKDLFEMIEQGLKALAVDLGNVRIEDLSPVDEFHLGGADGTRFVIEELKKVKKGAKKAYTGPKKGKKG